MSRWPQRAAAAAAASPLEGFGADIRSGGYGSERFDGRANWWKLGSVATR